MKGWILWGPFKMPLKLFLFKYNPKKVARYFVFPSVKKWAEKWKKVPHNYIKDVTLFSTDYVTSKKSSQKGRSLDRRHASSSICKEDKASVRDVYARGIYGLEKLDLHQNLTRKNVFL